MTLWPAVPYLANRDVSNYCVFTETATTHEVKQPLPFAGKTTRTIRHHTLALCHSAHQSAHEESTKNKGKPRRICILSTVKWLPLVMCVTLGMCIGLGRFKKTETAFFSENRPKLKLCFSFRKS